MLFAAFFIFIAISSFAQDTIILRNGDEIVGKVSEVSDSVIKYHLRSNLNGPVYLKKTSDILMIKYNGGYNEKYDNAAETPIETKYSKGEERRFDIVADLSYQYSKRFYPRVALLHRINRWVAVGGGLSFGIGTGEAQVLSSIKFNIKTHYEDVLTSNVFSRVLVTFTDRRIVPFISTDFGLKIDMTKYPNYNWYYFHMQGYAFSPKNGISFIVIPQVGISIRISSKDYLEVASGFNFTIRKSTIHSNLSIDPSQGFVNQTTNYSSYDKMLVFFNPSISLGYRHVFTRKR